MRKLIYYAAVTLDGYVASMERGDPSGSEFFPLYPDLVEHIKENYPETLPTPTRKALGVEDPGKTFDTVLEGRASYEIGLAQGVTNAYEHLRHIVFSKSQESVDDSVEIRGEDPIEVVRELKQEQGRDLWLVGGGNIAHTLFPEIDRIIMKRTPSIIGDGISMFNGDFQFGMFKPVHGTVLESGVEVAVYDRA
ncbi:dihydrofolate reductase family protein [Salininema proteolyticum]|uniref:Dihydrofolate reductase family protein n=1 Tax=Salininema proteolyticum TaxID=1607685 RepID=A0ABV8TU85_9ACTN